MVENQNWSSDAVYILMCRRNVTVGPTQRTEPDQKTRTESHNQRARRTKSSTFDDVPTFVIAYTVLPFLDPVEQLRLACTSTQQFCAWQQHSQHWFSCMKAEMTNYEIEWMEARRGRFVRWCASISMRYFRRTFFCNYVNRDARLTRQERLRLRFIVSHWNQIESADKRWFQWYVYSMMTRKSTLRPDLAGLRAVMALPHVRFSTEVPSGRLVAEVRFDPAPQIVCWMQRSRADGTCHQHLVGCIDEQNRLWSSVLWDKEVERWMYKLRTDPLLSMGRYSEVCPVCGGNVKLSSSWSLDCSLKYARWGAQQMRFEHSRLPLQCGTARPCSAGGGRENPQSPTQWK